MSAQVEVVARAIAEGFQYDWDRMPEFDGFEVDRMDCRDAARVVLATLALGGES